MGLSKILVVEYGIWNNGIWKWFSTQTSLIHTTDAFLKGIGDKKSTAYVLLDMSKAVDHQISLCNLQCTGTSTSVPKWFNRYVTDRYQVEWIHSSVSDPLPVECGVTQGSILGPLLFRQDRIKSVSMRKPAESGRGDNAQITDFAQTRHKC